MSLPPTVREADSVLVSGPPLSGLYPVFHRVLAARCDRPIVVSTGRTARRVRSDRERIVGTDDAVIIECASGPTHDDAADRVAAAGNLTEIGIQLTEVAEEAEGTSAAVGLHSLSELLMYGETETVYRFLTVSISLARAEGWPVVATMVPAVDPAAAQALAEPFDCRIETRTGDESEFRVRGGDWLPVGN